LLDGAVAIGRRADLSIVGRAVQQVQYLFGGILT
jgi:hypothetical protein